MRLGISENFPHSSPEEWAMLHKQAGLDAVVFPLGHTAPVSKIDAYVNAANAYDIVIAEVGSWCNPLDPDLQKREANRTTCLRQLELAEYIGAKCCVNISGAIGEVWDGSYAENYTPQTRESIIQHLQDLLDAVKPVKTKYTLEPMPHMLPDSPESYLELIRDVNRPGFGVHVDIVNMLVSPRVYFNNRQLVDDTFRLLGKYTASCHVKDAILDHSLTVSIRETECGHGGLDLAYYVKKADETDPQMPMIIEHLSDMRKFRDAISYIKSLTV